MLSSPTYSHSGWLNRGAPEGRAMTTDAINFLRAAITVLLFMLFVVLIAWAWSPRRRKDFEAASRIPFEQ